MYKIGVLVGEIKFYFRMLFIAVALLAISSLWIELLLIFSALLTWLWICCCWEYKLGLVFGLTSTPLIIVWTKLGSTFGRWPLWYN